jgi:uncharacterized protein with FMN-binding domain
MGKRSGGSKRLANPLVALSSAAVLAIYSAGYLRTRAAAEKIQAADRSRVVVPAAPMGEPEHPAVPPAARVTSAPAATPVATNEGRPTQSRSKKTARTTVPSDSPVSPLPTGVTSVAVTPAAVTPVASTPVSTPAAVAEPAATPTPTPHYKDGTYSGWGTSRHGDIEATVIIAGGRITSAQITQCWTRYSCSWVTHLQGQVVTRQSPEVDYVSGATQSTNAFYYAVVQALSKAK